MDRNIQTAIIKRNPNVALRKESVDRNVNPYKLTMIFGSRSPQGERG